MNSDVQIIHSLKFPEIATQLRSSVRRAFKATDMQSPDNTILWVDVYRRPDQTVYYRVSFYAGWPPSGALLTKGEEMATYLSNETGIPWAAHVARRRTRPTDSVKVVGKVDIDLTEWPLSRLYQLPRWE